MRQIKTFTPRVSVGVNKNGRHRVGESARARDNRNRIWSADNRFWDLTPYLGDGSSVVVSKGIQATRGTFSITIPDRPNADIGDTIYANLEAMDHVTIRMAHAPHEYGGDLPVVMRGFITSVTRQETMDDSGRPHRVVVIQGADYGKILEQLQVFYTKLYATAELLTHTYATYILFNFDSQAMSAKEFYGKLIENVVNPYLNKILFFAFDDPLFGGDTGAMHIKTNISDTDGVIWLSGLTAHEGSIWNLMAREADLSWNELFIEDREDAPYLVYRPLPFKDAELVEHGDNWIPQAGLVKPETIEVTHADLVAIHMTRSDQDVANFFLPEVTLAQPWLGSNYHKAMLSQDDPWLYVRHHLNCHPELYGDRKLSATLRQGYPGFKVAQNSRKAAEHAVHEGTLIDWAKRRREALARLNRDNSVWENGSLTLRGNERLKAGRYLRLLRGVVDQEAYMTAVTHNFMPYRSYTTQAHVIRGDGWLRRQRMQDRPALLERAGGLYR